MPRPARSTTSVLPSSSDSSSRFGSEACHCSARNQVETVGQASRGPVRRAKESALPAADHGETQTSGHVVPFDSRAALRATRKIVLLRAQRARDGRLQLPDLPQVVSAFSGVQTSVPVMIIGGRVSPLVSLSSAIMVWKPMS